MDSKLFGLAIATLVLVLSFLLVGCSQAFIFKVLFIRRDSMRINDNV